MIKGELVTLRAVTPADHQRIADFSNDVELQLLSDDRPPRPQSLAELGARFDAGPSDPDSSFTFAIEADGRFIGDCGLYGVHRLHGTAELGITIGDRNYWGRGYGRDAITVLMHYGFIMQNLRKVCLRVRASNDRAIRCYRSVGFFEEGRQHQQVWSAGQYLDIVLMALMREDWLDYPRPSRPPRHLNTADDD